MRREIYLIFKEALNNAVRHSSASTIDASLAIERQHLVLTVRDNGRLDLASAPRQGTVITLSAPIGRHAA